MSTPGASDDDAIPEQTSTKDQAKRTEALEVEDEASPGVVPPPRDWRPIIGGFLAVMAVAALLVYFVFMPSSKEAFYDKEHAELLEQMRVCLAKRQAAGLVTAVVKTTPQEILLPPRGWKRVSFIRHGEGKHNEAMRDWIEAGNPGVPYTASNDREFKYIDPVLTDLGKQQAILLQKRADLMTDVEVIVVSPMRRAIETALLAFKNVPVPVIAHEQCHETGGLHTCDKRLSLTELKNEFSSRESQPQVDFSQGIKQEDDPFWNPHVRETQESMAKRGGEFVDWLLSRTETKLVVAAHSGWLAVLFAASVESQSSKDMNLLARWHTGEMRTVLLAPRFVADGEATKDWLQSEAGKGWLKSEAGKGWLKSEAGEGWRKSEAGEGRLKSKADQEYVK